ncbi:alpha/beta hydrolase [Amycolatopsis sp. lyj-90]|uniref:alpha/beta hydrolase n=1 Tax=Amycolatopsis sp. lyj-90 TaxID=2789285 RepID=UPI00397804B5
MTTKIHPAAADTIVLVHGLWMTPLSWEHWIERYENLGFKVIAPTWPGLEGGAEALRRDPGPLENLGIEEIVDHYETIIRALDKPPIIIGHSFGGVFVQLLLDRGVGAAGVAIDSGPVKGVLRLPLTSLRAAFPVLGNPFNLKKAVPLTPKQFHYAFTNSLSEEESRKVYDRYHIPAAARVLFQGAFANLNPKAVTKVDLAKPDRAPLLMIAGTADHIVPPSMNKENVKRYRKSPSVTEYVEFPGRTHYIVGQDGWEEVADKALAWAVDHTPVTTN